MIISCVNREIEPQTSLGETGSQMKEIKMFEKRMNCAGTITIPGGTYKWVYNSHSAA